MMRIAVALLALLLAAAPARADDDQPTIKGRPVDKGNIGVGIILGEPTGVCAKLYLSDDRAIQVAAGAAFIGGGLQIDSDYLFHPWILQDRDSFVLPVYIGPGVRFIEYSGPPSVLAAGLRGVIGMVFDFKKVPLDTFLEVAIVGEYRGHTDATDTSSHLHAALNAGAGIRYYF